MEFPCGRRWKALVDQRRAATYEHFAQVLGVTRPDYRAALSSRVNAWTAAKEIRIRVPIDVLELVLTDGRVKNQFETARSGGLLNPAARIATERALFSIPVNAQPSDRPVYGYLEGSSPANLTPYGTVVLSLGGDLSPRTTFTFADSLDHTRYGTQPVVAPCSLVAPSVDALHTEQDVSQAPSAAHATPYGYVECQIHGGVAVGDIARVVFTRGVMPDQALIQKLDDADLKWSQTPGEEP